MIINSILDFFYSLNRYKVFIFGSFIIVAYAFGGEHFKPTIKYGYQWIHSLFIQEGVNYPEATLQLEAMWFFSKTASAYLAGLCILTIFGIFFGPALGFVKIIDELIEEKHALMRTTREYNELQTQFQDHAAELQKQHYDQQNTVKATTEQIKQLTEATNRMHKALVNVAKPAEEIVSLHKTEKSKPIDESKADQGDF